jgi:REP element-mobilizing transposase RayT
MRNRRDRRSPRTAVFHITNRTTNGLPFLCQLFLILILRGIMARAQNLYPVFVCHFLWMGNHYHLILSCQVEFVSKFIGYMQTEVARSIKILFPGMYERDVWVDRFREQRLATAEDVLNKIAYLYANPAKADLVNTIIEYPGFSSWGMYSSGTKSFMARWLPSRLLGDMPKLIKRANQVELLKKCIELSREEQESEFELRPDHWKRCFKDSKDWTSEQILKDVTSRTKNLELEAAQQRGNKRVIGARALKRQGPCQEFRSKLKSPTPYIICHDAELRKELISSYKAFCEECRSAWQEWKIGKARAKFPKGAYRPGMPLALLQT